MKSLTFALTAVFLSIFALFSACGTSGNGGISEDITYSDGMNMQNMKLYVTISGKTLTATLAENNATKALIQKLETAPITIEMSDYGGWEKVGELGFKLPASDERFTANPCDFVLYQGDKLVIFYGANSWSYTRLGAFEGVTAAELKEILGEGNVAVTLSITP